MNLSTLIQALREGIANPIVSYLGRGFGYTPTEGEYNYHLAWPIQTLGAGANSGPVPVTISQDAGYLWEGTVAVSTGIFSMLIRETGKEMTFATRAIHSANGTGTAQRPFDPSLNPYWYKPNTTITVEFADLSSATNTIYFAFIGRRATTDPGAFRYTRGQLSRFAAE